MSVASLLVMSPAFLNARPERPADRRATRRRYVAVGALAGAAVAVAARGFMRSVAEDPVFSWAGTFFIVLVFTTLGAAAGLALAWRKLGSTRRMAVQRGAALAPFALMGPFMPLFAPGLAAAAVLAHPAWRRTLRWALLGLAALGGAFLLLVFAGNGLMGLAAMALYPIVAYALFLTNRIALEPRAPAPSPGRRMDADPFEPWLGAVS